MSVIPLTLTISLCLVFTFVLFFILEQRSRHIHSSESESLLPLADEVPRVVPDRSSPHVHVHGSAGHECVRKGSCDSCRFRAEHGRMQAAPKPALPSTPETASDV